MLRNSYSNLIIKKTTFLLLTLFYVLNGFSQDIMGEWNGILKIHGRELPIVFHIEKTKMGYKSTTDSPKQEAYGMVMDSTHYKNDSLRIYDSNRGMTYVARLNDQNEFIGVFSQGTILLPLKLTREKLFIAEPKRPQEPEKPYPYISEEVAFKNIDAGITLAGTLTLPKEKRKFPAVILISGSGQQNRNSEVFGHKPFLVLSDYLTRHGVAVLRYDDRGVGDSEGRELVATSTSADFAADTQAALNYLLTRKEIDKTKIGLIGHSEGGMIAPMVATKSNAIDFLVLLAAPGIPGDKLLVQQNEMIGEASGMNTIQLVITKDINSDICHIATSTPSDSLKPKLRRFLKENTPFMTDNKIEKTVAQLSSPWMQFFLKYDPRSTLRKLTVPVLALNGGNDLQVSAKVNLQAIKTALTTSGNKQVTTKLLPGLNHLFQESKTGLLSEYGNISQTFSPKAMQIILSWIEKQIQ